MRLKFAALALPLAALPLLALGACGGAGTGVNSISSSGGSGVGAGGTPTGTTPTGTTPTGTTTGTTSGGSSPTGTTTPVGSASQANMFDVTTTTSFGALGAEQSVATNADDAALYRGNASTADAPTGTITYNPRDGIFTVAVADAAAGVTRSISFQDPAHRATADSARSGELQVPLLAGYNYLRALDGDAQFTFFYQRPTASGAFVSLAGFERSSFTKGTDAATPLVNPSSQERGVLVFGARTNALQVPTLGSAHYDGEFLATMVDTTTAPRTTLQWINGTSAVDVDFAKRSVALGLNGRVGPAYEKTVAIPDDKLTIPTGSAFTAQGAATWTASSTLFTGRFASAAFTVNGTTQAVDFTALSNGTAAAGASSIDGAFYGPDAKNIGGNFRIVGGLPNQRVDILGGFVGAKK